MARLVYLALVCFLGSGSVTGQEKQCSFSELNKGLDRDDGDSVHLLNTSDERACQQACCSREDCQLALIETPAGDGAPQCFLVNCTKDGRNICVLKESVNSKVFLKSQVFKRTNGLADYCQYEKEVGRCRAALPRFYYDVTDQTCKTFVYGGCGGNNNNFKTEKECQDACGGVTSEAKSTEAPLPEMKSDEYAEKCSTDPQVGLCRASIRRYYYASGTCKPFLYGGCGGNKNNYNSEEECMKACTVRIVDSKKNPEPVNKEYQAACVVSPDSGPCRASFRMFFFEPSAQSCKEFIYGGCKGNKNRYSTPEECMSNCAGKEGEFGNHGDDRSRWSPAFFLVSTLAIMSVVLLAGLLLISVRRAKHQRLLLLDDKQELLPEEYVPDEDIHVDSQ